MNTLREAGILKSHRQNQIQHTAKTVGEISKFGRSD